MDTTVFNLSQTNYSFYKDYLKFFNNRAVVSFSLEEYFNKCGYEVNRNKLTSGGNFGLFLTEMLFSIEDSFLFWKIKADRFGYDFFFNLGNDTHVIVEVLNVPEKGMPRLVANPMVITDRAEKVVDFFESIQGFLIKPSETKVGFGV